MTEAEWLAAIEPMPMIHYLKRKATSRKLRLLMCACCRRAWDLYTDDRTKLAVDTIERFCDGEADRQDLLSAGTAAAEAVQSDRPHHEAATATSYELRVKRFGLREAIREALNSLAYGISSTDVKSANGWFLHNPHVEDAERAVQAEILRDIFRNPFRLVTFSPKWLTSTATALARQMYDSRDFSAIPILADALQDAGCDNEDVLNNCRQPGEHVRGCWVVDLVLGKS